MQLKSLADILKLAFVLFRIGKGLQAFQYQL